MPDLSGKTEGGSQSTKPHIEFLDHLRILLTGLVVLHHTAITYGSPGSWYYRDYAPHSVDGITMTLLTMFVATNQAFFMGFFFLMAGYFTPASYEKKGAKTFLLDRFIRLGIPLAFYGFILGPVTVALAETAKGSSFLGALCSSLGSFGPGPLWFAETLLIFASAYVLWRKVRKPGSNALRIEELGHLRLFLSAILVGALALLIRQWYPPGKTFLWLQLGYFTSYVVLFCVGCMAWQNRLLEKIEAKLAITWFVMSLLSITFFMAAASQHTMRGEDISGMGGMQPLAVSYAFFEPFVAWGFILFLLWLFRKRFNQPWSFGKTLAQRAYTIYIIHPPVLVGTSLLMHPWNITPLVKFPLAGTIALIICVILSGFLLKIPGARKILV